MIKGLGSLYKSETLNSINLVQSIQQRGRLRTLLNIYRYNYTRYDMTLINKDTDKRSDQILIEVPS